MKPTIGPLALAALLSTPCLARAEGMNKEEQRGLAQTTNKYSGLDAGRFYRAGALLILCVMLTSCSPDSWLYANAPVSYREQKHLEDISLWEAAGSPPVVSCKYPFEIETPAPSGNMGSQAYTSMREFSQAAAAAQAPIWQCDVIGGSDTEPVSMPT